MNRNTLLAYPRSGSTWTQARLKTWASARKRMGFEKPVWWFTHAGYHPWYYEYFNNWRFKKPGQIFVLIRDAVKVVVSNWYWIQKNRIEWECFNHKEYDSLEAYVEYGSRRYASFLNWISELALGGYYFYEDTNSRAWEEREIPIIVGHEGSIDEVGWGQMQVAREKIYNSVEVDHGISDNLVVQIVDVMAKECSWLPYIERYGV